LTNPNTNSHLPHFGKKKFGLDAGVDIRKVQDLLGHRHITTTQIYDKRRRSTSESASHDVPI